jgi:hypothetical protein
MLKRRFAEFNSVHRSLFESFVMNVWEFGVPTEVPLMVRSGYSDLLTVCHKADAYS